MELDSYVCPVWQVPVGADGNHIYESTKYHCFVDSITLCGKYSQCTDAYDDGITVDSEEIARSPQIACKKCRDRWLRIYCKEDSEP